MIHKKKDSPIAAGFTLVEVIVVVAIIGIISAIALPATFSWLPNMRLKAASQELMGDMQRAKLEAIKRNINVVILFNTVACAPPAIPNPGGSYSIFVDSNANGIMDLGEPVITQASMPQATGLCNVNFLTNPFAPPPNSSVGFTPTGLPIATVTEKVGITLRNTKNRSYVLDLNIAGGITIN